MARPRQFDEAAALDAAVQCFWAQGYEATSVRDLAARMGITGASLYNAFGDKRALYRRAIDRYVAQSFGERARRLEAGLPPRAAIAAFFAEMIERSLDDRERKGCLLVNSALESAPADPELRRAVAAMIAEIEAFFRRCVEAGQRDGTISTAQPAEDLARLLLSVQLGLRVLARSRPERALLEGLVRPALALLDRPG
ncbi:transcriptional regulator, TetR family [Tistlia consotensis]|uniref:Transcriptional regulator, TetR family n=1 Tax=Tistlia consotensis USBA 355 TaxID=560819 RepID=A0A1Y6B638_9PROT|nr:TetR/AcrR family transcriptional regulator [Tistlia consotensis]SME92724.1 transcriptional regulator, TetR family [Tistlia consotensis USBA 355]SNR28197.1 transcriptional regulator, TetR family [Tistlia consotensis]